MVIFLGGAFGKDLEEEFHAIEGAFFPCSEMEGEVAVVVGDGGGFGVGFEESLWENAVNLSIEQNGVKAIVRIRGDETI